MVRARPRGRVFRFAAYVAVEIAVVLFGRAWSRLEAPSSPELETRYLTIGFRELPASAANETGATSDPETKPGGEEDYSILEAARIDGGIAMDPTLFPWGAVLVVGTISGVLLAAVFAPRPLPKGDA